MSAELAEVIVTLPVQGRYHYLVPPHMAGRARVGSRVLVRFGTRKVTGVVVRGSTRPPEGVELAELSEILDEEPSQIPFVHGHSCSPPAGRRRFVMPVSAISTPAPLTVAVRWPANLGMRPTCTSTGFSADTPSDSTSPA